MRLDGFKYNRTFGILFVEWSTKVNKKNTDRSSKRTSETPQKIASNFRDIIRRVKGYQSEEGPAKKIFWIPAKKI